MIPSVEGGYWATFRPHLHLLLLPLLLLLLLNHECQATPAIAQLSSAHPLKFLHGGLYNVSIYENSRPRTYVFCQQLMGVALGDLPSDAHVTYTIVTGNRDNFFIAEAEEVGEVAVLQLRTRTGLGDVLNHERRSRYTLTLEAAVRDPWGTRTDDRAVRTKVYVQVLDTNDNIPLFYPAVYQATTQEGVSLHTSLAKVTAQDADDGYNGQVYYFLNDPSSNQFAVHPTSGELIVTRPLRPTTKPISVIILAQDRGHRPSGLLSSTARASVDVIVKQVNNQDPVIHLRQMNNVVDGAYINIYAIVTVTDEDEGENGKIDKINIISGDPDKLFNIRKGLGKNEYNIVVLKLLDQQLAPNGYNLTLLTSDCGQPKRHAQVVIPVNIVRLDDPSPVFTQEQYEDSVSEEAPPNTPVVRLAADSGVNDEVQFEIVAGNEDERFSLDSSSGVISTADWLDAEAKAYYSLTVSAVDTTNSIRRKQSSAKVIIRVQDANDNAPQFKIPNTEVNLDENQVIGTYVTRVIAYDPDSGEYGFISYSIANLDQVPFTVDPFDGTVRTSSILDFESQRRIYTIKVRASDWGTPYKRETETTVKVKVRDVNDNRPQFEGLGCKGWVSIAAPLGTEILKVSALDLDENSVIRYILDQESSKCWTIDSKSGAITLTCDLHTDLQQEDISSKTFTLNVTASDGFHKSDPCLVSVAVITDLGKDRTSDYSHVECQETGIRNKLTEVEASAKENNAAKELYALLPLRYGYNSHAPEIPQSFPTVIQIKEDLEIGSKLLNINASDHDRGHNGRVVYAISGGNSNSVFIIGIESGILQVWSKLDHEKQDEYKLNITVYDLGVPHRSITKNLTIYVSDVNDNPPEFEKAGYYVRLPEHSKNGTIAVQVHAKDGDEGDNGVVTYELVTDVHEFAIEKRSGIIYVTNGGLDREMRDEYDLRVRAWDSGQDKQLSSISRVFITVLDVNDCAPDFGSARNLTVSIPEDLPVGAVIATLPAIDLDMDSGGRVTYSLRSGHEDREGIAFRIDPMTGIVRLARKLDYEMHQSYNITVVARDGGSPPQQATATLLVTVHDVDENFGAPSFPQHLVRAQVQENQPPGAHVIKLEAQDMDDGPLTYTITGGSGIGYFSVDNDGVVWTTRVLDRESARGYWLTLVVADFATSPRTDTAQMYIEVEDVNDHIPQTAEPAYQLSISEDTPRGSAVVALHATDGDVAPANITFLITKGNDLGHFSIEEDKGVLSTLSSLDRETFGEYRLQVTVSDGLLSSVTPVTVTLKDVNDNAPTFPESLYRISIPARSRSRRRRQVFAETAVEGDESLAASWGAWQTFSRHQFSRADEPLFGVFGVDMDSGINAALEYSIRASHGAQRFKIHPATGQVTSNKPLQSGHTYDLMVGARDKGLPSLSGSARVLLRVSGVPETSAHAPTITSPGRANVMTTDPAGHMISFITATDLDNNTLWYYITGGDPQGLFCVGVDTGVVSLTRRLQPGDPYQYTLHLQVTDGLHTADTQLEVSVMTGGSVVPQLTKSVYDVSVSEAAAVGTTILTLRCHDHDTTSRQSPVYYSLHHVESLHSEVLFSVDSTTGDITTAEPLDRETLISHQLTVVCRDRGHRERADLARVNIQVVDSNDHDPVFLEKLLTAKVEGEAAEGTAVTRVLALDRDTGENGRLTYSIVEGNIGGMFSIDSSLGIIRLSRTLPSRPPAEFLLLVRAADHGSQSRASSLPVRIQVTADHGAPPNWVEHDLPSVVEVSEWSAVGSAIAHLGVSTSNGLSYRITSGNEDSAFIVSPSSGVMSLARPLDYEVIPWYNVSIMATAMGGTSSSMSVVVRVQDENDWAPVWEELDYVGVVMEDAQAGEPVLDAHRPNGEIRPLSLLASDQDERGQNGLVTFTIMDQSAAKYFTIHPHTGAVRVAGRLREVGGSSLSFSVLAGDGGRPRLESHVPAMLTIKIQRLRGPGKGFEHGAYNGTVFLPTLPGIAVLCIWDENDNIRQEVKKNTKYSIIAGDENERFKFGNNLDSKLKNDCLIVHDQLNLKSQYNLTLRADDGFSTTTASAYIQVIDTPRSSLTFSEAQYFANVVENSSKVVNVVAVRLSGLPLNHHVRYSILNPAAQFTIRPTVGVIKTTGVPFDREQQDHYVLMVQATDMEDDSNFARILVNVAVLDENDNAPVFLQQLQHALVPTTAARGSVITQVRARDVDAGDNGLVRYELVRGSGELFNVIKKTGEITIKQPLMEAEKTYSLTLAAYDGGKPPLTAQASVLIRVVAAAGPIFKSAVYHSSIREDVPIGSVVTKVEAESPLSSPLIYTLSGEAGKKMFAVHYLTGVVTTASQLDYETAVMHNLTVRVQDPLNDLHNDAQISIRLEDVNDNDPEFTDKTIKTQVSESAHIGQVLVQVAAKDQDTGLGGMLSYYCNSGCDMFSVDSEDGRVTLKQKLDAENQTQHSLTVIARDLGLPTRSASATIVIQVIDLNDNVPVWRQEMYNCRVSTEAQPGHMITTVTAYDPDVTQINPLHYQIYAGDSKGIFRMGTTSGILSVIAPKKLRNISNLNLNISVSDGIHMAFTTMHVNVVHVYQHSPRFISPSFETIVDENNPPGQRVLTLLANTDYETSESRYFNIIHQTVQDAFRLDQQGNLYSDIKLDRESKALHIIQVSISDDRGLTDFATVRVIVNDKNDNAPRFSLKEYQGNIPVDMATDSSVLRVEATDDDEGENSRITYKIDEPNGSKSSNLFSIDSNTGIMKINKDESERTKTVYQFFVRAEDQGIPYHSADVAIKIFLLSPSEFPPQSSNQFSQYFIREDAPLGSVITSLWVGGPQKVKYSIISEQHLGWMNEENDLLNKDEDNDIFAISPSGLLVVQKTLDHEHQQSHRIIIANQSHTEPVVLDYMTISVVVMDINDCSPQFSKNAYEVSIQESTKIGTTVTIITAIDNDDGNNGQVQYSLNEEDKSHTTSKFRIDPHSGALTLISSLDREKITEYAFEVVATDGGSNPLRSSAKVNIIVKDDNDNPPIFIQDSYVTAVPEDATIGTVILELEVSDADETEEKLDFYVTGGDTLGHFLVYASGQLYVAQKLDREIQDDYFLTITATDGKFTANTTVSITIIDVNDNGPECKELQYHRAVSEDVPLGTYIVSIITWDADEGVAARSSFSLSGEKSDHFKIDKYKGTVSTKMALNREDRDKYSLIVIVEDWEHPQWQCQVSLKIDVEDVNDNAPIFSLNQYDVTIKEDAPVNSIITKINAKDLDLGMNSIVYFTLVDSADGYFRIDKKYGFISLLNPLDRETQEKYSITIKITDQGSPPLSSVTHMAVTVLDVNDNSPEFGPNEQQITVSENSPIGTETVTIKATSKDIGVNADLFYTIDHTTTEKFFDIDPKTGVITIANNLDYEFINTMVLTVTATDSGRPPLSAEILINVNVTDINDNAPIFTQSVYDITVKENSRIGLSVFQIAANDPDFGINGEIHYGLASNTSPQPFKIDKETGVVTLIKSLDREQVEEYRFDVLAWDLGTPSNSQAASVLVKVGDINDNPPIFTSSNYSIVIQENRPVGYSVVGLMARDSDSDPNGAPFTWELLNKESIKRAFYLEQDGTIKLATDKLDQKIQKDYVLQVRIWDSGSPPLHTETDVQITVVEESRFPPIVFPLSVSLISYRSPPEGIVGRITARDEDSYDKLEYSIVKDSERSLSPAYFDIDNEDGTLMALYPLDDGVYEVNVSVSDGHFERSVKATIKVRIIDENMLEHSVILRIGPISPVEFLSRYQKLMLSTISSALGLKDESISILSIQPTISKTNPMVSMNANLQRKKRNLQQSLDILLVMKKNNRYFTRQEALFRLKKKEAEIKSKMNIDQLTIIQSVCNDDNCKGIGNCIDLMEVKNSPPVHIVTEALSLVAPQFGLVAGCQCQNGSSDQKCHNVTNSCARRSCAEYQDCSPSKNNPRGYTCQCPEGRSGPLCQLSLGICSHPSCHYPQRPMSFKGESYAQYSMKNKGENVAFSLTLFLRMKNPVGTIMYSAGDVDYSILEVVNGHMQYQWNCGSGEGLVRVSSIKVTDGKWHFVNLTRDGTKSRLGIDGEESSGSSPGLHDNLNVESDLMFIGATISRDISSHSLHYSMSLGLIGCLDQIRFDGTELPISVTSSSTGTAVLKRLANVELKCPDKLQKPGICSSYPCLNGGTCTLDSKGGFICTCSKRFGGNQCQVDTAPCSLNPCLNGGTCIVDGNSYKCECPSKLSGKRCEYGVHCNPNPCKNSGVCEEGSNRPLCKCQHFTGTLCDEDIDECTHNPCINGGTCLNFYGGFKCFCNQNATGNLCAELIRKSSSSSIQITLVDLLCTLAVFLAFVIAFFLLIVWQRRLRKQKRTLQNNRIKLTDFHVKNDLKSSDTPKRNSKICNVEADQVPPAPPRPSSYTPSGGDSALLQTLKQLADISAQNQTPTELNTLNKSLNISPTESKPPDTFHKPWDLYINLNDSFMQNKAVVCDSPSRVTCEQNFSSISPADFSEEPSAMLPSIEAVGIMGSIPSLPNGRVLPNKPTEAKYIVTKETDFNLPLVPRKVAIRARHVDQASKELPAATPLFTSDARDAINPHLADNEENEDDDEDSDPCSIEEVLSANKMLPDSPTENGVQYNFVVDLEEDYASLRRNKLSPMKIAPENNKENYGKPRNRQPFNRSEYSQVTDISFLSELEDDSSVTINTKLHNANFNNHSDKESSLKNKLSPEMLIQSSHDEVFL